MNDGLELSSSTLDRLGELVKAFILSYFEEMDHGPVSPRNLSAFEVGENLSEALPDRGQDVGRVWQDFLRGVVGQSVRVGHPRFLAWIRTSPLAGAVYAEALAAALNQSVAVWDGAPAATEVEKQVIHWLIEISGYDPQGGGILTSGGSMANFSGLLAARSAVFPAVRQQGLRDGPPLAVYLTSQTHYSVHKALEMMGLGREATRIVSIDENLKMDPDALQDRIRRDRRAGVRPMAVVATVGTTSTGTCDDLRKISRVCREEDVWLHVDGAYGGFAALVPDREQVLQGIRGVDSFVLDPHKNLFMPFEAGCLLVRNPDHLRDTFGVVTDYLPNSEDGRRDEARSRRHFRDYGPQLSRSFRALKIYLSLKLYGVQAIAGEIQRQYRLAGKFADRIRAAEEFELMVEPELGVVAFRCLPPGMAGQDVLNRLQKQVVDRLHRRGKAYLSRVEVQGQAGLRACFVSHRTRLPHLDQVLDEVRLVVDELS